jgi:hypothetical protein
MTDGGSALRLYAVEHCARKTAPRIDTQGRPRGMGGQPWALGRNPFGIGGDDRRRNVTSLALVDCRAFTV